MLVNVDLDDRVASYCVKTGDNFTVCDGIIASLATVLVDWSVLIAFVSKVRNCVGVTTPSIVLVNCWTEVVTVTFDSVKAALVAAKEN